MKDISKIKDLKTNNKELEVEYNKAKKDPTFKEIIDSLDLEDDVLGIEIIPCWPYPLN